MLIAVTFKYGEDPDPPFAGLELPMARLNLKNEREGKIERRRLSFSQLSINIID